jgi:hypothetical protein
MTGKSEEDAEVLDAVILIADFSTDSATSAKGYPATSH